MPSKINSRIKYTVTIGLILISISLIGLLIIQGIIKPYHRSPVRIASELSSCYAPAENYHVSPQNFLDFNLPKDVRIDDWKQNNITRLIIGNEGTVVIMKAYNATIDKAFYNENCRYSISTFPKAELAKLSRGDGNSRSNSKAEIRIVNDDTDPDNEFWVYLIPLNLGSNLGEIVLSMENAWSYLSFSEREIKIIIHPEENEHQCYALHTPPGIRITRNDLENSGVVKFDQGVNEGLEVNEYYFDPETFKRDKIYISYTYEIEEYKKWKEILTILFSTFIGLGVGGLFEAFLSSGIIAQVRKQMPAEKKQKRFRTSPGQKSRIWKRK